MDFLINFDPANIIITRHTKVPNEGGYVWVETILDAITVRVYQFTTHNQSEFTLPEGEVKSITHGVLANKDADIVVGHDSYDTFPYDGRTFRIIGIRHYTDSNVPEVKQADCVAV